ncbi:MAG: YbaB/EbfC family nucleoid-associated protein [Clostridiales bacterium]|nr:YbaB/EbfC family nucleoid-associated protein [Clostridiales bacterium]
MKGMPPMGGNMNNLLKQAQKLQKQMEDMKEEIEKRTVEASSGGGAVTAIVTGKKEIVDIKIKKEVVDPDDVEMLQDLIIAALNEALTKANDMMEQEMAKVTGGLNVPGLF